MKRLFRPLKIRHIIWLSLLALIAWALRDITFADVRGSLGRLSLVQVMALILLNIGILILFSSRWWLVLRAQGFRLPYFSLVLYRLAAAGINYFTPGPQFGGEPFQVYIVQQRHWVPGSLALASVTLDKLLELLANFTFLVIGVAIILEAGLFGREAGVQALLLVIGLFALPAGYMFILSRGKSPATWLAGYISVRQPAVPGNRWLKLKMAHLAIAGVEEKLAQFCRRNPRALVQAFFISALVWFAMVMEYWLMLHFLGLRLNVFQVIASLTAARLAYLLPIPAGLGVLEASQVMAMQALGIHPALGISISMLIRARDISFGATGLWLVGVFTGSRSRAPLPVELAVNRLNGIEKEEL